MKKILDKVKSKAKELFYIFLASVKKFWDLYLAAIFLIIALILPYNTDSLGSKLQVFFAVGFFVILILSAYFRIIKNKDKTNG